MTARKKEIDVMDATTVSPEVAGLPVPAQETKVQEIEKIEEEPKEIVPYQGMSMHVFSDTEVEELMKEAPSDIIEIRADGLVYVPGIFYRNKLNRVFKPGGWALIKTSLEKIDNYMYYHGRLYIRGKFVAEAIGEQKYFDENPDQSFAAAAEAAKTDCLTRCCKDLGIYNNLWSPDFVREWIEENAVKAWCVNQKDATKKKALWRKKSQKPIDQWPWKEMGSKKERRKEGFEEDSGTEDAEVEYGKEEIKQDSQPSPDDLNKSTKYPPWFTAYTGKMKSNKGSLIDLSGGDKAYYDVLKRFNMNHCIEFNWKEKTSEENYKIALGINEAMERKIAELKKLKDDVPDFLKERN